MDETDRLTNSQSHLYQRGSGSPPIGAGVIPEGSHLELPAPLHTLPVASYDVQVVVQDHRGEAPLIGPKRQLRHWAPVPTVLWSPQDKEVSGTRRLRVVPGRQVLLPEATEVSVSSSPQRDNLALLFIAQTPEIGIRNKVETPGSDSMNCGYKITVYGCLYCHPIHIIPILYTIVNILIYR